MLAKLEQNAAPFAPVKNRNVRHLLMVLPKTDKPSDLRGVPFVDALESSLGRRKKKLSELAKAPLAIELDGGTLSSWVMVDPAATVFERHTAMRKAVLPLLEESPQELTIAIWGSAEKTAAAELAVYAAWVNGAKLPQRKKKSAGGALALIRLHGAKSPDGFALARAQAEGNTLCRELTALPPNELTPGSYRVRIRALAKQRGWTYGDYGMPKLRKMGAGAFVAVAQGSDVDDAAIVHLRYRPKGAKKTLALVGKGICFDTGGHNLKPARYMSGMHEDMNGSAVALGILLAASEARLPVNLDCWMALAQNHLSPRAYKQGEVVTALNGTTIEVVHTDAEGRMVLADTLTLAAREKPALMITFATLTGSMHTALGNRYSGIFATSDKLSRLAIAAGVDSGERVSAFPMDDDYDSTLDSVIADVKQCTLDGDADHILAARLLKRFTDDRAWIHVDLSGSSCKGGLGAVGSDVTGFGVGWGMALLREWVRS